MLRLTQNDISAAIVIATRCSYNNRSAGNAQRQPKQILFLFSGTPLTFLYFYADIILWLYYIMLCYFFFVLLLHFGFCCTFIYPDLGTPPSLNRTGIHGGGIPLSFLYLFSYMLYSSVTLTPCSCPGNLCT